MVDLLVPRPFDRPTTLALTGALDIEAADAAKIFAAPDDPGDWPAWRRRLAEWRDDARRRSGYDGSRYDEPATSWASRCFSVALVWLWDERLFDHERQVFTVDAFVDRAADFGGFDGVVLWQAYPVIGIDHRTQFDFYRDVPGLDAVIASFHRRGVRVFVDYNPWDTAAGDEADHPHLLAALVADLGVDGVFLDTMSEGGAALRDALGRLDPAPVLEGESRVSLERTGDHQLSWAQWFADSAAPGVLRARWFERRHLLHHTRRWNRDHSNELQSSWMNGTGMLVWDAVFGSWVGWNARDRSTLRAMQRAQRALADVLSSGEWTPLTDTDPQALAARVFASRFHLGAVTLWTLVNRGGETYHGPLLAGPATTSDQAGSASWFDVVGGRRLDGGDDHATVPANGVTGVVRVVGDVPDAIVQLVAAAAANEVSTDASFPERTTHRSPVSRSTGEATAAAVSVSVTAGLRSLAVVHRLRETGLYDGAPFVEAWKPLPPILHAPTTVTVEVDLSACRVAAAEVTVAELAQFLHDSGYRPAVPHRFFNGPVTPGAAGGDRPATYVNLADTRAYAAWVGGRLPTEFEWQVAAAHPDFIRRQPLVWNLTESELTDGVTRSVMLKGGCAYEATDSEWYFDGGPRAPDFTARYLLAGLGVERSTSIGFRIAWDITAATGETAA